MRKLSNEQVIGEQCKLAILTVKSKDRLKRMKKLHAPDIFVEMEVKILEDRKKRLNGIGSLLVPYVRV